MATNLADEVYQQLRQRKSERAIKNDLVDRGYTEEYAENLIAEVKEKMPALRRQERDAKKGARKGEQGDWLKTVRWGASIFGAAVLVVAAVFIPATLIGGEPGPIGGLLENVGRAALVGAGFGLFLILKGLYHRLRWW